MPRRRKAGLHACITETRAGQHIPNSIGSFALRLCLCARAGARAQVHMRTEESKWCARSHSCRRFLLFVHRKPNVKRRPRGGRGLTASWKFLRFHSRPPCTPCRSASLASCLLFLKACVFFFFFSLEFAGSRCLTWREGCLLGRKKLSPHSSVSQLRPVSCYSCFTFRGAFVVSRCSSRWCFVFWQPPRVRYMDRLRMHPKLHFLLCSPHLTWCSLFSSQWPSKRCRL